jgi:two-component system response regulator DevR
MECGGLTPLWAMQRDASLRCFGQVVESAGQKRRQAAALQKCRAKICRPARSAPGKLARLHRRSAFAKRMAASAPSIRLLVVDDSVLVREGLRAIITSHGRSHRIEIVGEAGTATAGIAEARRLKPDVALLDIRLPDGSGLDACREISRASPQTRVLILTSSASDELIHQAIVAGAQGYLMKEIDPERLIRAIADAAAGKPVLTPEITARVMNLLREGAAPGSAGGLSILSTQERRVLALVADGLTNKEIGAQLGLSDNTVKNYLASVFEKLQVKRRAQATALFVQATRRDPQ